MTILSFPLLKECCNIFRKIAYMISRDLNKVLQPYCTLSTAKRCSMEYVTIANFPLINLFVCFVALRPKSTAMVIAGRSVHLTTLFPGQA